MRARSTARVPQAAMTCAWPGCFVERPATLNRRRSGDWDLIRAWTRSAPMRHGNCIDSARNPAFVNARLVSDTLICHQQNKTSAASVFGGRSTRVAYIAHFCLDRFTGAEGELMGLGGMETRVHACVFVFGYTNSVVGWVTVELAGALACMPRPVLCHDRDGNRPSRPSC